LELCVEDEGNIGTSRTTGSHYFYYHEQDGDDDERVDPRSLVRPSAPVCGRRGEEDEESEDELTDEDTWSLSLDGDPTERGLWLDGIPIVDDEDFEDLFSLRMGYGPTRMENISYLCSNVEKPLCVVELPRDQVEDTGSEDGEGDVSYDTTPFKRKKAETFSLPRNPGRDGSYGALVDAFYLPILISPRLRSEDPVRIILLPSSLLSTAKSVRVPNPAQIQRYSDDPED